MKKLRTVAFHDLPKITLPMPGRFSVPSAVPVSEMNSIKNKRVNLVCGCDHAERWS